MANPRGADSRLIVGIIFLLLGVYFLLSNLDLISFQLPDFITSWQVFLILIGLLLLASRERIGGGITLVAIGIVCLLPEFFDITVEEIIQQFWPVAFLIIGAVLLFRRSQEKKTINYFDDERNALAYLDETAILGGNDRLITSNRFQGGRITTLLGGNEVNLVNARLADGQHELDIFTLFGSTELTVPRDWNVTVDVTTIVGSFEDRRHPPADFVTDASKELIVKGLVLFGAGELVSV